MGREPTIPPFVPGPPSVPGRAGGDGAARSLDGAGASAVGGSRKDRLGAALRANLARRKAQARARAGAAADRDDGNNDNKG